MSETKAILISEIRLDGGTQSRHAINQDRVHQMAAQIDWPKGHYPSISVFFDGEHYWPDDGIHRTLAATEAGQEYIKADVKKGTLRDAFLACLSSNFTHDKNGMHRSKQDRIAVITKALTDPELSKWSNNEVARICKVDVREVAECAHLRQTAIDSKKPKTKVRKAIRGGKVYTMRVSKIGKKRRKSADEKLAGMKPKKALKAIQKAEESCTCTCPACRKCKRKK